ncbi:hypothetical protein [Gloeothece verrucosa]|uniref:Peptidase domain protein n=1 Tax=Gloeothece verrucosa (strain PCC 7822) TaxID=497965 RepID=E0UG40_GLOV7|nr:hypothetical protein [Gloeothece verrucosa]ADN15541.1 hypothetical protein Cyan7822_3600 [Gloeothece verrucosa PCC 7822]
MRGKNWRMINVFLGVFLSLGLMGFSDQPLPIEYAQACTTAQRGSSQSCPQPITFAQGAYGALVNDRLSSSPQTRYYSLAATGGQRLTLTFAGAGPLRAGITFPGGGGDGPFDGEGNTIELPRSGTYIIYISQNTMAGQPWRGGFSLALIVR